MRVCERLEELFSRSSTQMAHLNTEELIAELLKMRRQLQKRQTLPPVDELVDDSMNLNALCRRLEKKLSRLRQSYEDALQKEESLNTDLQQMSLQFNDLKRKELKEKKLRLSACQREIELKKSVEALQDALDHCQKSKLVAEDLSFSQRKTIIDLERENSQFRRMLQQERRKKSRFNTNTKGSIGSVKGAAKHSSPFPQKKWTEAGEEVAASHTLDAVLGEKSNSDQLEGWRVPVEGCEKQDRDVDRETGFLSDPGPPSMQGRCDTDRLC